MYHSESRPDRMARDAAQHPRLARQRVLVVGTWRALEAEWVRTPDLAAGGNQALWLHDTMVLRGSSDLAERRRQARAARPTWLLIGGVPREQELPEVVSQSRVMTPSARLAMLGSQHDRGRAESWIRRGCTVYMSESATVDRVLRTLNVAESLDLQIVDHALYLRWQQSLPSPPSLTLRQREVLRLIRIGYTNDEIAKELTLTRHTVEFHIRHLLQKLGARNRTEAAEQAHLLGLC